MTIYRVHSPAPYSPSLKLEKNVPAFGHNIGYDTVRVTNNLQIQTMCALTIPLYMLGVCGGDKLHLCSQSWETGCIKATFGLIQCVVSVQKRPILCNKDFRNWDNTHKSLLCETAAATATVPVAHRNMYAHAHTTKLFH